MGCKSQPKIALERVLVGSLMVDQEAIETLLEMYDDDVENLDLLVGMSSEKKTKGFVNRETTFIFFSQHGVKDGHARRRGCQQTAATFDLPKD
ncbi:alpha-dioxygenase 1-like protein [Tanacetum coccineum]